MNEGKEAKARIWWSAFRYHFIPPSIFPATLGGVISWAVDHTFSSWFFSLVLIGVIINHMGLNMTDDYFDYKYSVDHLKPGEKNPYTGGSGTLSSGVITPANMFKAFTVCYLITASIGVYLTIVRGLPVLAFVLFGLLCSIFYTTPPVSFSHHGLGELGLLINFGTTIGLGSYFVQTQRLTVEAFLATLPLGIMLFSMIVINEIPDYEEDRKAGKLTLVARQGKKSGIKLYVLSWVFTYSIIVGAVTFQIMPAITLISLLSLPLVYRSIRILRTRYNDPVKMAPANLDMIKAHGVTSLLLIAAYSLYGLFNGAEVLQLIPILLLLTVFYAPVAAMLIKVSRKQPS
jgi:1,4-dihydroxy-2-naphthoate octaprenyltransferase